MATFLFWEDSWSAWAWASISASSLTCKHLIFRFAKNFARKIWQIHIILLQHMILDCIKSSNYAEFFQRKRIFMILKLSKPKLSSSISWFCLPVVRQECILVRVQIHMHWMILVLEQLLVRQRQQLQLVEQRLQQLRLVERLKKKNIKHLPRGTCTGRSIGGYGSVNYLRLQPWEFGILHLIKESNEQYHHCLYQDL